MSTKKATWVQICEINELLDRHAKTLEGRCVYDADWSDEKIAETVGSRKASVSKIRSEKMGTVRPPAAPKPTSGIEQLRARVDVLETRVLELHDWILNGRERHA